jgi:quercetin dioxygenase-like cupin family protein
MADTTVVRHPGEGDAFWMLGGIYALKAGADETNGAITVMEMTIPPGSGPPPHTHPGGEAVYVLEGNLRYHIDGEVHEGGPGSFFYIPAGITENFEPAGDGNLRLLVMYIPGGIENFFAEAGEPAQSNELPPPPSEPPDLERLVEIGARHGMNIEVPA